MTGPGPGGTAGVVVVGAGHAGATPAAPLRQGGYRAEVSLIGNETDFPYQRPPLSKKFTGGGLEQWLRPAEFYREQVTSVDRSARRVHTASGDTYGYDFLVPATGAAPRKPPLPGADLDGVITLRTLADARVLRTFLREKRWLAVIGGGYIGLEAGADPRPVGPGGRRRHPPARRGPGRDAPPGEHPRRDRAGQAGVLRHRHPGHRPAARDVVLRGDPASGRFALFHHEDQVVAAVESADAAADFAAGRTFIASRRRVDPLRPADPAAPLSDAVLK